MRFLRILASDGLTLEFRKTWVESWNHRRYDVKILIDLCIFEFIVIDYINVIPRNSFSFLEFFHARGEMS